jgi:hypothetical protein
MTAAEINTIAQTVALAVAQAMAGKATEQVVAKKVAKPPRRAPRRAPKAAEPVAKPAKPAKPAKTYDGPYAVKVQFSKTGGLIMHGGARVFYRPEGTEAEQLAWLEHNGLDGALYVGLVKSPKHKNVWLTYAESKANRS